MRSAKPGRWNENQIRENDEKHHDQHFRKKERPDTLDDAAIETLLTPQTVLSTAPTGGVIMPTAAVIKNTTPK